MGYEVLGIDGMGLEFMEYFGLIHVHVVLVYDMALYSQEGVHAVNIGSTQ